MPPPPSKHFHVIITDFSNAAKRLNYVQKITTLVVVKRTRTNTLTRTCRKHNKSGVATTKLGAFRLPPKSIGGLPPGQNHGRLYFLHPPHPTDTFFCSCPCFWNSRLLTGKTLGMWSSRTRTRAPVSSRLLERPRPAARKYTTSGFPHHSYVSSRRKLVAAIVFWSLISKGDSFVRLSQKGRRKKKGGKCHSRTTSSSSQRQSVYRLQQTVMVSRG